MAVQPAYECHCCGWEPAGYKKSELEDQGWKWHKYEGGKREGVFVLCCDCEMKFAERRGKALM